MKIFISVLCLMFVLPIQAWAGPDSTKAVLSVESRPPGSKIYVDSLTVGTTPMENIALQPGVHILTVVHPAGNSWLVPARVETVDARAPEHIERVITFPAIHHITSVPYGAEVWYNDSMIGKTPLLFSAPTGKGIVTLRKDGYERTELPLAEDGGAVYATLASTSGMEGSALVRGEQLKSMTPVYLSSGVAVVSGTLAAYFKIKADGYYDDYLRTGDEDALRRVRKFDSISGVALVTSELGLIMLSYFLFSR